MWSVSASRIDGVLVCRWLLLAAWPMNTVFAVLLTATVALGAITGQSAIVGAALMIAVHYAAGLGGSFALHELGHLAVLSRATGVTAITLERSLWRTSISPHGRVGDRDAVLAALAGPGACVVVGAALWLLAPGLQLHGWYLAHAVFLIPVFNDGRILWSVSRARHTASSRAVE